MSSPTTSRTSLADRAMTSSREMTKTTSFSAVNVSIDGVANDGSAGEKDNVSSDIEELDGSAFNDTLTGSSKNNTIYGEKGNDLINGMGGNDDLIGDADSDTL